MTEPAKEFSNISLNFNGASRSSQNPNTPTLIGTASVVDADGSRTEFRVAAWGPKTAKTGGPDFYDMDFTPADPAAAARQVSQRRAKELGPVRNAVEGFEINEIGRGKIFERCQRRRAFIKVAVRVEEMKSRIKLAFPASYPHRPMLIALTGTITAQGP